MKGVHPAVIRKFLSHMGKVHVVREAREHTRREIHLSLDRVKTLASARSLEKPELQAELRALEQKLEIALENESLLLVRQSEGQDAIRHVSTRIAELDEKLSAYHEFEKSRAERIVKIEDKVERKLERNDREVNLVEEKISELEKLYEQVKKSGDFDHERVDQIKKRMDEFRERLEKIK